VTDWHSETRALHARVDGSGALPATTPVYLTSGFAAGSPYFYTRHDNPNCEELERALCALEQSAHATCVTTGMAAIATVLPLLRPGDHVVVSHLTYGCSYRYLCRLEQQVGVRVTTLDLTAKCQLPSDTALVFLETPTNPFLATVDIRALRDEVEDRCPGARIVVDNTWATPLFQRPLAHGADVSLYSATKYFSGHSDVMGGVICTNDAELDRAFREQRFYAGAILDPHSAWLLRRSLHTLPLRMCRHAEVTSRMRSFLQAQPQIARVFSPEVDGEQLVDYGGILFVELREDLCDRYEELAAALELFGTGTAMACVTSMIAQPYTGSHASLTDEEKQAMGIDRGLVRLCFGLEPPDDLVQDLSRALARIDRRNRVEVGDA